jgi:hypothetical protein
MKPAEKVLRSWIRSLPTDARNVNIFNADGVLTRDSRSDLGIRDCRRAEIREKENGLRIGAGRQNWMQLIEALFPVRF